MQIPETWPPSAVKLYEPIRTLGKGGFASVVLARNKVVDPSSSTSGGGLVAMKVVSSATQQEEGYVHREVDILRELDHPNIVKLLDFWEVAQSAKGAAAVMALSYAAGPSLESLLGAGGAVSLRFARVVTAQVVSALSYLHSRAVIHRDIKPDNLIIVGAHASQDEIWEEDAVVADTAVGDVDWSVWRKKWHVVLVDFGFARALTPNDLQCQPVQPREPDVDMSTSVSSLSKSGNRNGTSSSECHDHHHHQRVLSLSKSRKFTRQMSAVGSYTYAAPEILDGIQTKAVSAEFTLVVDVTKTLSDHVATYGMMADAYSLGCTLKYMLTGIAPDDDVAQRIAMERNPLVLFCRLLCQTIFKKNKEKGERYVKYRPYSKLPKEVFRLIQGLTHYDPQQRTSIRMARQYPWVDDVLEDEEWCSGGKVDYLSFVTSTETILDEDMADS